ncbi:MAG: hypothetical protein EAZ30_09620 [Betaproteobacteria bacterium]|nr:MAG: hypothetical protein EAZ43_06925 [Betaproteobacteria bacterium]TAG47442.1 MAG: hypothetical protein EAZ30_09620 [Betaproteobacteria bacterium]
MIMALNRIQFQLGLSLPDFMKRYGSDEQCEAALVGELQSRRDLHRVCNASDGALIHVPRLGITYADFVQRRHHFARNKK